MELRLHSQAIFIFFFCLSRLHILSTFCHFQMGDHIEIMKALSKKRDQISYSVLTPNIKGLRTALDCGAKEVAIFGAASKTFSQRISIAQYQKV